MNNVKRFTICKLAGHKWLKIGYPASADGERSGAFLRCQRCAKEDHEAGNGRARRRRHHVMGPFGC